MKIKEGLRLREIAGQGMVVRADQSRTDMTEVFTLNETASFLWKKAQGVEFTAEDMASWLMEEYGIDQELARKDAAATAGQWKEYSLIDD